MEYSNTTSQYGSAFPPPNTFEQQGQYGQQPAGYTQQPQGWGQQELPPGVLVVQPKPLITEDHFKPYSTTCPQCRAQITTETSYKAGKFTKTNACLWGCAFGMFGLCIFAAFPFCMDSCKDVTHTCPQCHGKVAEYQRHEMTPRYSRRGRVQNY